MIKRVERNKIEGFFFSFLKKFRRNLLKLRDYFFVEEMDLGLALDLDEGLGIEAWRKIPHS